MAELLATIPESAGTQTGLAPMVMIVEDDHDIACSLMIRLRTHGMRTCLATNALEALQVAQDNEPDCAILDINMPGGNGFDVAQQLKEEPRTLGVPVIFLTASMRPDLKDRADAMGAAAFMTKPYDATILMETVRKLASGGRFQGE